MELFKFRTPMEMKSEIEKTNKVMISLKPETYQAIKHHVSVANVSMNRLINNILEDYIGFISCKKKDN